MFQFSLALEEMRNMTKLYNPLTVEDLQKKYPSIPWLEYLNTLLPEKVKVRNDEVVIVRVPLYLEKFEKLISTTDKRYRNSHEEFI